jgi:hypothetical protein
MSSVTIWLLPFLSRTAGRLIGEPLRGKVLAAAARQSRQGTTEGGLKIPEVLSELSYRPGAVCCVAATYRVSGLLRRDERNRHGIPFPADSESCRARACFTRKL